MGQTMFNKQPKPDLESIYIENDISMLDQHNEHDSILEPIIQKILKQQEEMNRFKDICNPGISFGFYHYW